MCYITALYKFCSVSDARIDVVRDEVFCFCEQHGIRGLFLLSKEGCNGTMSGTKESIEIFKDWIQSIPEFGSIIFKDSTCETQPFKRLKVDLREEIVTLKRPDIVPASSENNHLTPKEWHEMLKNEDDILLIDTRNFYETEIGMFQGAVDPHIENFSEFQQYIHNASIDKDKKILMYCTGGIRCEKALVFMQQEGYNNVFQLQGGILNYLKEFPEGYFDGECFVFDHRVSVDSHLSPSSVYKLCPHCGNPAKEHIHCAKCGAEAVICFRCKDDTGITGCTKNCEYYLVQHMKAA